MRYPFVLLALLAFEAALRAQLADTEIFQDMRAKKPLQAPIDLVGPNVDTVSTPEELGLRIQLPANRQEKQAVGVKTNVEISGDFEITATYDLLHADLP